MKGAAILYRESELSRVPSLEPKPIVDLPPEII